MLHFPSHLESRPAMTAATLTLSLGQDGQLIASVPAIAGHRASSFTVPETEAGMRVLMRVLTARLRSAQDGTAATVGTDGSPNVSMIEDWLRAHPKDPGGYRHSSQQSADDLGL